MPTVLDEATVELMDYQQFLDYAADSLNYSGQTELLNHITQKLRANPFNAQSSLTTREQWAQEIARELESNGYRIEYNGNDQWTGTVFPNTAQVSTPNPVNSNITNVGRGSVRSWYGGLNEFGSTGAQTWVPQRMPVSGGLGSKAMYFLGSVGSAVGAASTGIWLGKTFDAALYNAMPDFWDSIGWSSLNPETWGNLTEGSDSPFAGLLNFILGIDGENGNAQAYISEEMLAYLSYGLYQAGVFGTGEITPDYSVPSVGDEINVENMLIRGTVRELCQMVGIALDWTSYYPREDANKPAIIAWWSNGKPCVAYNDDGEYLNVVSTTNRVNRIDEYRGYATLSYPIFGKPITRVYYYGATTTWAGVSWGQGPYLIINQNGSDGLINFSYNPSIEGIGNQEGATLPDTTGWDDLSNVLPSLQQQYPDAFNNPMIWNTDTPYDDTAGNQTRYIPVPFPFANSATDTQPISGTQTQTNTALNTTPQDIIDLLTKTIQQTDTQPATPPTNPTDTGTGGTPVPTAPVGSASALWSVYHPTQAQVNSFGAWLWGSPFLTNIGKLFQNPIEGVISLHKVFAPPVDSGSGNIVVGTLDSGVASATVNQQYVEVDCGSVTLSEDFGNVFDYDPYTKVALYLPFVGIVPLNVADVMRSTINVKYGVDIFTGACIAMVSVSRDGNDATLYQYSGNCAVHYPLSNVQQSQLLSGLITVAAGIGSIVASGGAATPAAVAGIAGGGLSALHSNVGRSGGFSANAGAMGIKVPYLIIERPQTKVAETFPRLIGYPTNYSVKLGSCSNHVVVKHVHVEGINATESELEQIESLLKTGVLV